MLACSLGQVKRQTVVTYHTFIGSSFCLAVDEFGATAKLVQSHKLVRSLEAFELQGNISIILF
jgi:hypothetical protein